MVAASLVLSACSGVREFGLHRADDGRLEVVGGCTGYGISAVKVRTLDVSAETNRRELLFGLDHVGPVEDAPTRVVLSDPGPAYAVTGGDPTTLTGMVVVSVAYTAAGLIATDMVIDLGTLMPGAFVESPASEGGAVTSGSLEDYLDDRDRCRLDLRPLALGAATILVALVLLAIILTRRADRREQRTAPPAPPPPPAPVSSLPPPPPRR